MALAPVCAATYAPTPTTSYSRRALDYVRIHRPPVFLLENVPALLGRHRWVLDRLLSLLASDDMPKYEWYWDIVCPTEFGGVFSRPRLFVLGWVPTA